MVFDYQLHRMLTMAARKKAGNNLELA